ncbi:MAG: DEAD/DEAH box helicase, partial [Gemmataceae bacterium]
MHERVATWFQQQSWQPFAFQRDAWEHYARGADGLVHAATGTGKTLAAWLGPVQEWLTENPDLKTWKPKEPPPLTVLWLTPLRALAADTAQSLANPIEQMGLPWRIQSRTGDTSSRIRTQQKTRLPTALITTPESLTLLLTHADTRERFAALRAVIVDEWHELLASKRGVLVELALARLRSWNPNLRTWGLSATLGNLPVALATLTGPTSSRAVLVQGHVPKTTLIDAILPPRVERFPWAGHIGLQLLPQVIACIEEGATALVFTNTRAQTET